MNNDLLKHPSFGNYIKQSAKSAKKEIALKELEGLSEQEKMGRLVKHVKQNYSWNTRNGKYAELKLKQFKRTRNGNSANLNLFLVGLLQAAGLDANAVIISTRDNGKIRSMTTPFDHYFNYVIASVNVNGEFYLLDATDPLVPDNMLPTRCINDKGLIVKKNAEEWQEFQIGIPSLIQKDIDIVFSGTDMLNFTIQAQSTDYDAVNFRKRLGDDVNNIKVMAKNSGYELAEDEPLIEDYNDISKPFRISYKGSLPAANADNKIIFSPFLKEPISENPFKQQVRNYPVDYIYPEERVFNATILIPEGYIVDFVPGNLNLDNKLVQFSYETRVEENKLMVSGKYTLKKAVYQPSEYSSLKYFMGLIVKTLNQEIVLMEESRLSTTLKD